MSGLNVKLADLQISDFHAPECCFFVMTYWKNLQLLGALPPDPYQGLCPWTPLGAYCGPQTLASFSSFFTFSQSHVWNMSLHWRNTSTISRTIAEIGQCNWFMVNGKQLRMSSPNSMRSCLSFGSRVGYLKKTKTKSVNAQASARR